MEPWAAPTFLLVTGGCSYLMSLWPTITHLCKLILASYRFTLFGFWWYSWWCWELQLLCITLSAKKRKQKKKENKRKDVKHVRWLRALFWLRYLRKQHLLDVTEIFSHLGREKKYRLVKLAFYLLLFVIVIFKYDFDFHVSHLLVQFLESPYYLLKVVHGLLNDSIVVKSYPPRFGFSPYVLLTWF